MRNKSMNAIYYFFLFVRGLYIFLCSINCIICAIVLPFSLEWTLNCSHLNTQLSVISLRERCIFFSHIFKHYINANLTVFRVRRMHNFNKNVSPADVWDSNSVTLAVNAFFFSLACRNVFALSGTLSSDIFVQGEKE